MELIYAIAVIAFVILSGVSKSAKQKPKNSRGYTGRPRDMQDKLETFLDAVTDAKIPEKVLESIPFLKTQPEPTPAEHADVGPEGTACDIPHSLLDPRLAQEPEAAPAQQNPPAPPARPAPAPTRAFSARDMRQAVITSEILARPVSLRGKRF